MERMEDFTWICLVGDFLRILPMGFITIKPPGGRPETMVGHWIQVTWWIGIQPSRSWRHPRVVFLWNFSVEKLCEVESCYACMVWLSAKPSPVRMIYIYSE